MLRTYIRRTLRTFLGLIFLIFGLNGFLHFLPMIPMPAAAGAFIGAMVATGYMIPLLFAVQVLGGAMLLAGFFVPLGLVLLAPVVVNILLFHVFLDPGGLPLAIAVNALEAYLALEYREAFRGLLRPT